MRPSTSEALVVVLPPSRAMMSLTPMAPATPIAPITPATGPDSTVYMGNLLANSKEIIPPSEVIAMQAWGSSVRAPWSLPRYLSRMGRTYALSAAVENLSYSLHSLVTSWERTTGTSQSPLIISPALRSFSGFT